MLHVDFEITYLGLNIDMRQHAYVLKSGKTEASTGIRQVRETGNRLQDIRIMLEKDAFFDGDSLPYINGRQTELLLIPRQ